MIYEDKKKVHDRFILMEGYVDSSFVNYSDSLILKKIIQENLEVDFYTNPINPKIGLLVIDKGTNNLFSYCKQIGFDYINSKSDSIVSRCCADYVIEGKSYLFIYESHEKYSNFCLRDKMRIIDSIKVKKAKKIDSSKNKENQR